MLQPVDYDEKQHAVYARGRAIGPEVLKVWMKAFAAVAPTRRPLAVLDLGCGIGRFTPALADTFGGPVYGVEPSARMRQAAEADAAHRAVTYLEGRAENIALPDDSCDLVLMYLSFHHVRDRAAAAREIARVLRPDGRLLLRSVFSDRLHITHAHGWHRFFTRAQEIERQMFPSLREATDVFAAVGLNPIAFETIERAFAPSLAANAEKLRHRAISTFEHMTEEEIADGFRRLDAAVAAETEPQQVLAKEDLLVLG